MSGGPFRISSIRFTTFASQRWGSSEHHALMVIHMNQSAVSHRPAIQARRVAGLLSVVCLVGAWLAVPGARAPQPRAVMMTPDRWEATDAEFGPRRGVDAMLVKKGVAVLKDVSLGNGTIEFDVEPTGFGPGVGFRRRDADTYEDFYLRPQADCAQKWDCTQYAPFTRGVLLWDLYPQYQSPASLRADDWNHVKLVISGRRMRVYINGSEKPALDVGRLLGEALDGGILLQGPGYFARMTVSPGATEGLSATPAVDESTKDKRFVTNWRLAPHSALPADKEPILGEMPAESAAWKHLQPEIGGLMNISREYGLPLPRPERAVTWLRTTITSDRDQTKTAAFGWTREVWVFVNGKQVYAGKNLYQPPDARKKPEGRCSLENGSLTLPLTKGRNEIAVALANNFYGWALMMRLDNADGIQMPRE